MKAHRVLSFNAVSVVRRRLRDDSVSVSLTFSRDIHRSLFGFGGVRVVKVLVSGVLDLPLLTNLLDLRFECFYL